jgi:hypothetical protein
MDVQDPMPNWRELLTCTFDGPQFEDGGLDLRDLSVLIALDALLVETAKELWRQDNQDRERMPGGTEAQLRLRFFRLEHNCTTVRVFRAAEPPLGKGGALYLPLLEPDPGERDVSSKLDIAAKVVVDAFGSISRRELLPNRFPKKAFALLRNLHEAIPDGCQLRLDIHDTQGSPPVQVSSQETDNSQVSPQQVGSLPSDGTKPGEAAPVGRGPFGVGGTWAEAARQSSSPYVRGSSPSDDRDRPSIPSSGLRDDAKGIPNLKRPEKPPARASALLSSEFKEQLVEYLPQPYEDDVELIGEVTAASIKGKASIHVPDKGDVQIEFAPDQEKRVTGALHEHESRRLRIIGRGIFEPIRGKLTNVSRVDRIDILDGNDLPFDENAEPIWRLADELTADVPDDERRKLPTDLATNLDSYLYGSPKKPRGQS